MIKEIKSCCVPVMSVMLVDWDEGFNYSIAYEIPIQTSLNIIHFT